MQCVLLLVSVSVELIIAFFLKVATFWKKMTYLLILEMLHLSSKSVFPVPGRIGNKLRSDGKPRATAMVHWMWCTQPSSCDNRLPWVSHGCSHPRFGVIVVPSYQTKTESSLGRISEKMLI